ncbi:unnamed protein product, partial [Staurois parvus]
MAQRTSAPIIRALMISALMISAQQCHPSVLPSSRTQQCPYQCPSVLPICATSSVPISAAYQCPSVLPINAASSMHISEG